MRCCCTAVDGPTATSQLMKPVSHLTEIIVSTLIRGTMDMQGVGSCGSKVSFLGIPLSHLCLLPSSSQRQKLRDVRPRPKKPSTWRSTTSGAQTMCTAR